LDVVLGEGEELVFKMIFRFGFVFALLVLNGLSRPNIVVLYSDDAGYADFGFQSGCREEMKALTPHIDRIAKEGARFTNAYMCGSVCSPSRAGLMTGRYPQRFGYDNNLPPGTKNGLELKETFGAKRMQKIGYKTGLIGKWHLGYPEAYHPNRRGFDWFYGLLQGARPYPAQQKISDHKVIQENGENTPEEGYVTDRFGDAACRFIKENKEETFYLFVSFTSPHGPLQPKESDLSRVAHIKEKKRKGYAGLIVSLDDNVGKVLDCLKSEGLEENTIVLFTNDNGGQTQSGANNFPLQGKKGTVWEGGLRVPWAMRWPGKIKKGSVVNGVVSSLDLIPTFLDAGGAEVKEEWKLDGQSFLNLLDGSEEPNERILFWRQGGSKGPRAMREGKWKVVEDRKKGMKPALFDLTTDIGEATDLSELEGERFKAMLKKLDQWESKLEEPRWGPGKVGE
jgi:arylsulfatase A-like enzyme